MERLEASDRVDQHIPMEVHAVLGREYTVDILTSSVDEFHLVVGGVDSSDFGESCNNQTIIYYLLSICNQLIYFGEYIET